MTPWVRMATGRAATHEASVRELQHAFAGARCLVALLQAGGRNGWQHRRALLGMLGWVLLHAERALRRLN